VCGRRAERHARHDFQLLRQTAEKLSCAPEDLVSAAASALAERDANFKNFRALVQRLATAETALALGATSPGPSGLRIVSRVLDEVPAEFMSSFAAELAKTEKAVALLARLECGQVVFAQHPSSGKDMSALLKQVLDQVGGKGGGTRDFARGKLSDPSKAPQALEAAIAFM
jgi:alanyl-tRNA synthetase